MPAVDARWPDGSVSQNTTDPWKVAQVLFFGGMLFKPGTNDRVGANLVGVGVAPNPDEWVIYLDPYSSASAVPLRGYLAGDYDGPGDGGPGDDETPGNGDTPGPAPAASANTWLLIAAGLGLVLLLDRRR